MGDEFYIKIKPKKESRKVFLDFIKNDENSTSYGDVTKTNWKTNKNATLKLKELFNGLLYDEIYKTIKKPFTIKEMWYQLYGADTGSKHEFHTHDSYLCDLVALYYLKLKSKKLITEFLIDGEIVKPDVNEGDLIIFSSKLQHRSPENFTPNDKIIISINVDTKLTHKKNTKTII